MEDSNKETAAAQPVSTEAKPATSQEAWINIKSGSDKFGKDLLDAYKFQLDTGLNVIGLAAESELYRAAKGSADNIDRPGEANKLLVFLQSLRGQDYTPVVEVQPGASNEEKDRLLREKLVEDTKNLPDYLAQRYLERTGYIGAAVRVSEAESELDKALQNKDLSRADVRRAAYNLERFQQNRVVVIGRNSLEVGKVTIGKSARNEQVADKEAARTTNGSESFVEFSDREESERTKLLTERREKYRNEIREEKGDATLALFDKLPENEKQEFVTKLTEVDLRIEDKQKKVERSAGAKDAGEICKYAGEVKRGQVEKRQVGRELNLSLARQRSEDAISKLRGARDELGMSLSAEEDASLREKWANAGNALKEVVDAKVNQGRVWVKEKFGPAVDILSKAKDNLSDTFTKTRNWVDKNITERVKDRFKFVKDTIKSFRKQDKEELDLIKSTSERAKIEAKRTFYEKRHRAFIKKEKLLSEAAISKRIVKQGLKVELGRLIATKDKREIIARRRSEVKAKGAELIRISNQNIEDKNKKNPLFERFNQALREEAIFITTQVAEVKATPAQSAPAEAATQQRPTPTRPEGAPGATTETAPKKEKIIQMDFAGESDVGKVRDLDEDSFFSGVKGKEYRFRLAKASEDEKALSEAEKSGNVSPELQSRKVIAEDNKRLTKEYADKVFGSGVEGLFIVADGVGGSDAGEVSSQMATQRVLASLAETEDWSKLSEDEIRQKIRGSVETANKSVFDEKQRSGRDLFTTFTMAMVVNGKIYTANVGDSRVYLYNESSGDLTRLTKDHSLVQHLVDAGMITDEERYTHAQNNVISRQLGNNPAVEVDVSGDVDASGKIIIPKPIEVKGNVKILATCDGLWEKVRDPQLKQMLSQGKPNSEIVNELIKAANDAGGNDNITAVVAELKVQEIEVPASAAEAKSKEKFMQQHPGMKDYEVVQSRDSNGQEQIVMTWWDGEKLRLDMVDAEGNILSHIGESEAQELKDARSKFNDMIKELENQGVSYTRNLHFILEKENLQLLKGEEKDFWTEKEPKDAEITEAELWKQIDDAARHKKEAEAGSDLNRQGKIINFAGEWSDRLFAMNNFMSSKLPTDLVNAELPEEYSRYTKQSEKLSGLYQEMHDAESFEKWDELLSEYAKGLREKYDLYVRLSPQIRRQQPGKEDV